MILLSPEIVIKNETLTEGYNLHGQYQLVHQS